MCQLRVQLKLLFTPKLVTWQGRLAEQLSRFRSRVHIRVAVLLPSRFFSVIFCFVFVLLVCLEYVSSLAGLVG